MSNIFDPPSKEEMNSLFAAPTENELKANQDIELDQPGLLESFLRGAGQGATFGFADEITAALESASDLDVSKDEYEKNLAESREAYAAAEQANPLTTIAGNVTAGLIPGAGMLKAGTGLGSMVKAGMAAGALSGAGTSEANLLEGEIGSLARDTVSGGATGAIAGALIPAAIGGTKSILKFAGQQPIAKEMFDVAKLGATGKFLSKEGALDEATERLFKTASNIPDRLSGIINKSAKRMDDVISKLPAEAEDTRDLLSKIINIPKAADKLEVKDLQLVKDVTKAHLGLNKVPDGIISQAIEKSDDELVEIISNLKASENTLDHKTAAYLETVLSNLYKTPQELREVSKGLNKGHVFDNIQTGLGGKTRSEILSSVDESLLEKMSPDQKRIYELAKSRAAKTGEAQRTLKLKPFYNRGMEGAEITDTKRVFDEIKRLYLEGKKDEPVYQEFFKVLEQKNPGVAKVIRKEIESASKDYNIANAMRSQQILGGDLASLYTGIKSQLLFGAEKAGQAYGKVVEPLTTKASAVSGNAYKLINELDNNQLDSIAAKLLAKGTKTAMSLGSTVKKLTTAPRAKQKAMMFALLQKPEFREVFESSIVPEAIMPDESLPK